MDALAKAQESQGTIDTRAREVETQVAALEAQHFDEADLARALEAFDPIWDVLLTPEKERVLRLLIEKIAYDGTTKALTITFHPTGIATLAAEVAS